MQLFIRKLIDTQEEALNHKKMLDKHQVKRNKYSAETVELDPDLREHQLSMIVRNNYRYRPHISYNNLRYFQCEDQRT